MRADLAEAAAYLRALDPVAGAFTFQYFPERPGARVAACHPHGPFPLLADQLEGVNRAGAGVFVTVNRTNGDGRSAAHITTLRALFIDCDAPRRRPLAVPPSMSVATRPGRGHHYWLLRAGEPLDAFRDAQAQLAAYYGSDPSVIDLGRVLRLPGFWNMKADPFRVRLARCHPERRYTIAEIRAAHALSEAPPVWTPAADTRSCAEAAYRHWARSAPLTVGSRNNAAFRLAVEGFRAGLDPAAIEAEVQDFCARSGIASEAAQVLRAARRAASRALRQSSASGCSRDRES